MGGPGSGNRSSDVAKGKTKYIQHNWSVEEMNALAVGVRKQMTKDGTGPPKWTKILRDGYFVPTLKPGEMPLKPRTIMQKFVAMGGINYKISWEKQKPRPRNHEAPIPVYAPLPVRTRAQCEFHAPDATKEDDERVKAEAARRAEPRPTGWAAPVKEPPQPVVCTWPEAMKPIFGTEAWREHVESGRERAREREMVTVRKFARGLADELRRSIAADDHLDDVVRPAWKLPRLADIARDATVLTPQS